MLGVFLLFHSFITHYLIGPLKGWKQFYLSLSLFFRGKLIISSTFSLSILLLILLIVINTLLKVGLTINLVNTLISLLFILFGRPTTINARLASIFFGLFLLLIFLDSQTGFLVYLRDSRTGIFSGNKEINDFAGTLGSNSLLLLVVIYYSERLRLSIVKKILLALLVGYVGARLPMLLLLSFFLLQARYFVFLGAIVLIAVLLFPREMLSLILMDVGNLGRYGNWMVFIKDFEFKIFGEGIGYLASSKSVYETLHFESSLLSSYIEMGLVGVMLLFVLVPLILKKIYRNHMKVIYVVLIFGILTPSYLSLINIYFFKSYLELSKT